MKKAMIMLLTGIVTAGAQAAVMNWGADVLADTRYGYAYPQPPASPVEHYAYAGTDVYLIYNGIGNTDPFIDVWIDESDNIIIYGGTVIDSYITDAADFNSGGFARQVNVPDLDWLGDTSATWDDMNDRTFTVLAVSNDSDDDGDWGNGGWSYGKYTANASGFSTAMGPGSIAEIEAPRLDAGQSYIIPEPATISLMGIAGLGMFLARRKVRS